SLLSQADGASGGSPHANAAVILRQHAYSIDCSSLIATCNAQRMQSKEATMLRLLGTLFAIVCLTLGVARADDGLGLKRGGNGSDVTISGISSGAAMAVQYAVAHSGSIAGVGSVAGLGWGCADGSLSRALNDCMCGRHAVKTKIDTARQMAASGKI